MHKIVKLFHGSNVVPDVLEAGRFYHDFLGSWVYEAQFLEFEGSRNGANLMGGVVFAIGAPIGAGLMELIRNSLLLAGIDALWQQFFVGLFLILAVLLEQIRNRRRN